jgi:hypothetical protein
MTTTPKPPRARKRASDPDAPPRRRMRGFEAAVTLVAPDLRRAAEKRGFAVARLLTDWPEIVGPETAAHTRPVKVSHGKGMGATLTLLTDGAHAPLVQMQLPRLRERVNAVYGFNAISRIVVTQTAAQGFADGQAQFRPAPPPEPPPPTAEAVAAAERVAALFSDPRLAESMRQLALARATRDAQKRNLFSPDRKAKP